MNDPSVDIFSDFSTADTAAPEDEAEKTNETNADDEAEKTEETPREVLDEVPDGAISVPDFAAFVTQELMKAKFTNGEPLDGTEYTQAVSVYQAIKAQRNPLPHVLVKGDGEQPRVWLMRDEAFVAWKERLVRLVGRGTGATRASSRTPEDNLILLAEAEKRRLYGLDRKAMWEDDIAQRERLVAKYKGFLKDANVDEETVSTALTEAYDSYQSEKAAKEAEKKSKKEKETANANA